VVRAHRAVAGTVPELVNMGEPDGVGLHRGKAVMSDAGDLNHWSRSRDSGSVENECSGEACCPLHKFVREIA
jgi:hypothetical protein